MVILQSHGILFVYRFINKILEKSCCNIESQSINGKSSAPLDNKFCEQDYDFRELSSSSLHEFSDIDFFFQNLT